MNKPFTVIWKRSRIENHDNLDFPHGVNRIIRYSFSTFCKQNKPRKYIVEIHEYRGYAMLKFYPRHHKDNKRKYELRGVDEVGYVLPRMNFLFVLSQCSDIMKRYLDRHPEHFIGYVGQVDKRDNQRNKLTSQRSDVYNFILSSIIDHDKYKIITRKAFKEINVRLIRKNLKKDNSQTEIQKAIYRGFLEDLSNNNLKLFELMTNRMKMQILEKIKIE
nr:hypothetical protein [uncultured Fluviicola sp.]